MLRLLQQELPNIPEGLYYIAALITALVGTYLAESIRRKNAADAADSLTSAAMKIVDQKDNELRELRHENSILRIYIQYLLSGISQLRVQLGKKVPAFTPQSLDEFR